MTFCDKYESTLDSFECLTKRPSIKTKIEFSRPFLTVPGIVPVCFWRMYTFFFVVSLPSDMSAFIHQPQNMLYVARMMLDNCGFWSDNRIARTKTSLYNSPNLSSTRSVSEQVVRQVLWYRDLGVHPVNQFEVLRVSPFVKSSPGGMKTNAPTGGGGRWVLQWLTKFYLEVLHEKHWSLLWMMVFVSWRFQTNHRLGKKNQGKKKEKQNKILFINYWDSCKTTIFRLRTGHCRL